MRTRRQRRDDERRFDDEKQKKEQEKQQRRHAKERERTRVFGLSDYANEAAGDVAEWSFNVGNKGAHFPARGLHVLMRDFIMFCADDDVRGPRAVGSATGGVLDCPRRRGGTFVSCVFCPCAL